MSQERTESMWIICLRVNLDHCIFGKTRANKRSLGAYLEEGNVDCSFSRKPSSCSALAHPPSNVSGVDTRRLCWPDVGSILFTGMEIKLHSGRYRGFGAMEQSWVYMYTEQERPCRNAQRHECGGELLAGRVLSDLTSEKGFWDNWSSRQWIVENARDRSSRLLRLCFMSGQTGDEHARNQIQHKMERASRVMQGIRKENRSTTNSIRIPHVSGFLKQTRLRAKSIKEKMNNSLLQKLALLEKRSW